MPDVTSSDVFTPKASRTACTVAGVDVSSRLSETRSASTRQTLMPRSAKAAVTSSARPGTTTVSVSKNAVVSTSRPPSTQGAAQGGGEGAHARRDGHESGGTVPHGIHARHDGEEHLRGADVGGRLLAADVLLARLQGQAVGLVALGVDGDADEAAGDLALEAAVDGHVAGVRTAEAHRDAEALRAADGDVGAPLSRGAGQGEREQVGAGRDEALGLVDGRRQRPSSRRSRRSRRGTAPVPRRRPCRRRRRPGSRRR